MAVFETPSLVYVEAAGSRSRRWPSSRPSTRRGGEKRRSVLVGRHVAQVGRPHDGGGVADGLRVHVERRDDRPQLVGEVHVALAHESSARMTATGTGEAVTDRGSARRPDDGYRLLEQHSHLDVEGDGKAGLDHHAGADGGAEPRQDERHVVRPGRELVEREPARAVRGGSRDFAAGLVARLEAAAARGRPGGCGGAATAGPGARGRSAAVRPDAPPRPAAPGPLPASQRAAA